MKNATFIIALALSLTFIATPESRAQIAKIQYFKNLQSPNIANLGVYGEIPVSPFTGTPNIEIPLYEISVRDKKIPITLSYHPGGVKPDQHPSWVGLGWTLNAGGAIYRITNYMEDEYEYKRSGTPEIVGYFYNCNTLNTPN